MRRSTTGLVLWAAALWAGQVQAGSPPSVGERMVVATQALDARAQVLPACASDGASTFLVTWQQGEKYFERPDAKVYAARVSGAGKSLDAKPIALCAADGSQERPRVAFSPSTGSGQGGGVFLAVWQDFRDGNGWDIYAARVKPDGTLLDNPPLAVAALPGDQALPEVAAGPDGFLVVWQDRRSAKHYELYGARIAADGKVRDPNGTPLGDGKAPFRGGRAGLCRAANAWHLIWWDAYRWRAGNEEYPHFISRITEAGGSLKAEPARLLAGGCYNQFACAVAGGETRFLYANGGGKRSAMMALAEVYDAVSGKPLENPNPDPTKTGASGWNVTHAMVVLEPLVPGFIPPMGAGASKDHFLVVVRQASDGKAGSKEPLRMLRINADGKKLDEASALPILDEGQAPCMNPAVAGGKDGQFLVVYEYDAGTGKHEIVARIVKAVFE